MHLLSAYCNTESKIYPHNLSTYSLKKYHFSFHATHHKLPKIHIVHDKKSFLTAIFLAIVERVKKKRGKST